MPPLPPGWTYHRSPRDSELTFILTDRKYTVIVIYELRRGSGTVAARFTETTGLGMHYIPFASFDEAVMVMLGRYRLSIPTTTTRST